MSGWHVGKCYRCQRLFQTGPQNDATLVIGQNLSNAYRVEICDGCALELARAKTKAEEGPHV